MVRVGGIKSMKVNTRVIVATNRNLEEMVEKGSFRSDLYFRLSVVPLRIPSLAERKEEIVPLIDFFLARFNREYKVDKKISRAVKNSLLSYSFPGNIRELEHLAKRLVAMTEDDDIKVHHLPERFLQPADDPGVSTAREPTAMEEIRDLELQKIQDAVNKYGSQLKAATALGLSQSTVSRKLKRA